MWRNLEPLSRLREREAKCDSTWQGEGNTCEYFAILDSTSMSFSAPSSGAVTFLLGKVTKAIGAGHDGLANVRFGSTALRFSPGARRRELAHPCAQTVAPFPRARLRCSAPCDGAELTSTRPSMACQIKV
jgi:hypothetical protein